jgi:hypothetical protein
MRHPLAVLLGFCVIQPALIAQTMSIKDVPKAEILFAAQAPPSVKDENGKPALATLEPIAFLVGGELRDCYDHKSQVAADAMEKTVRARLSRAYAPKESFPLWWRGRPWGRALAVNACYDEDLDFKGCFKLISEEPHSAVPKDFAGIAFSGKTPAYSHPAVRAKADPSDRRALLKALGAAFAKHDLHFDLSRIHIESVWKTQLRSGTLALTGSALVQVPAASPQTYDSYRMFLVAEENNGLFVPVQTSFHKTTIKLEGSDWPPKPGEEIDEENDTDLEVFFDNFPIFAGEPDAVITRHTYYEDWNFSVYRRKGATYQLVYTGCGGGA